MACHPGRTPDVVPSGRRAQGKSILQRVEIMLGNGDRSGDSKQRAALPLLMAIRSLPRIAALAALLLAFAISLASAQPRDQTDFVFDGDTIRLDGDVIRLFGIDAPEGKQTCRGADGEDWDCGVAATASLRLAL